MPGFRVFSLSNFIRFSLCPSRMYLSTFFLFSFRLGAFVVAQLNCINVCFGSVVRKSKKSRAKRKPVKRGKKFVAIISACGIGTKTLSCIHFHKSLYVHREKENESKSHTHTHTKPTLTLQYGCCRTLSCKFLSKVNENKTKSILFLSHYAPKTKKKNVWRVWWLLAGP